MPTPTPMPSPPILRTSTIMKPQRRHHVNILPSNRSISSAPPCPNSSSKFSWTLKKLTKLILLRNDNGSCTPSDLTEENLQEHNKRQAMSSHENPYYKGLTNQTLAPGMVRPSYRIIQDTTLPSPGRESRATAVTAQTSFTSISSFIIKMKEWSACSDHKNSSITTSSSTSTSISYSRKNKASGTTTATRTTTTMRATTTKSTTSLLNEMGMDQKKSSSSSSSVSKDQKLLRERVSEEVQPPITDDNNKAVLMPSSSMSGLKPSSSVVENPEIETDNKSKGFGKENKDASDKGLEKEFVWATKYRPKALKDFLCNRDKAMSLQGMSKEGDCGHFIFQGPPGVGKRTMVWAILREAFGAEKVQAREEHKIFDLKGESRSTIDVIVKESPQHVEVSVSELKGYEKHIIVELIKETDSKLSKKALQNPIKFCHCQAIILHEAEKLSTDVLLYIKWLLERYKHTKMFFCCTDASKLQPIRNLCTLIQLSLPSKMEIVEVLEFIAKKEGINLPNQLANKIADTAKNNLRQAIRSFEATCRVSYPFKEDQTIMSGWEDDIAVIAKKIIEEQSPIQLYKIRRKLQTLFEHDVSSGFIFKCLVEELKKYFDEALQSQVDCLYAEYKCGEHDGFPTPHHLRYTRYPAMEMDKNTESEKSTFQHFMRIEEFIARFMSCYKSAMANRNKNIIAS